MAKLRYKKLASGKFSIYIDSYLPETQKRQYEFLKLYVGKDYSITKKIAPGDRAAIQKAGSILESRFSPNIESIDTTNLDVYPGTLIAFVEKYYRNTDSNRYFIQHLKRFLKGGDSELEDIDIKWIQKFENYLNKQELASGSIAGYLSKLKISLNKAVDCKLISTNPIAEREIKMIQKESLPYLTENEVEILIETEVPFQQQIKDAFLFSLYSGLGWSNIYKLSASQITYNDSNDSYVVLLKYLGSELGYYIELDSAATQIMLKYYKKNKPRIFDKLSGVANTYKQLQLWQALAGIQGEFSFSVARNTFAMRNLKDGISLSLLRSKMGLREIAAVRIYEKMHQNL